MNIRSALFLVALLAAIHALVFIWYQQPDWNVAWSDQGGYRLLANGLVRSGQFTRYPDVSPFVPEAIRTPGYPLFVAFVSLAFGTSHLAVALVQGVLFAGLCLVVYATARAIADQRTACLAALLTACYSPIPYYGALVLTEVWTTFVMIVAMCLCVAAIRGSRLWPFAAAGLCLGWAALSRPVFILLPFFLIAGYALTLVIAAPRSPRMRDVARWGVLLCTFLLTVTPWFVYNYRHFGRITVSSAGGIGRPVWEGSWQGMWPGRLQAAMTDLADHPMSDDERAGRIRTLARENGLDAAPMLVYVRQWRDIRRIWTTPTAPEERVEARIEGDREYLRVGLANISAAPLKYLIRRATRGMFVLWAGELPIRYTRIDHVPRWTIAAIWLAQVVLLVLALVGWRQVWRGQKYSLAIMLATPLVYVTAVHFFLLTEARQSLPVKPLVLIFAAVAVLPQSLSGSVAPSQRSGSGVRVERVKQTFS